MADLVMQEAYHDHVADALTLGVHLVVAEASHVVDSDDKRLVSPHWFFGTDELAPIPLPALEATGQFGQRASADEYLPGIQLSARTASRADDLDLPDLGIAATGQHETLITGDNDLPTMSMSASVGIRCDDDLKLSDMGLTATAEGGLLGTLDKYLPGFLVAATGYAARTASLSADLPALEASVSLDGEVIVTLAKKLPAFTVSATGSVAAPMTLNALLPALESTTTGHAGSMTLSGYIPPPVVGSIGLGDLAPGDNAIESTDRYADYVLRHAR